MTDAPTLPRWHTREDSGIRLDRDLVWWHDGERFEHPRIIEVFNCGLVPTDDGRFQLHVGKDWCFVTVEDAAYRVTGVDASAEGIFLRLSDQLGEKLAVETLELEGDVLVCHVKAGRAKAIFSRQAQFALGSMMEEREGKLYLTAASSSVPLPFAMPAEPPSPEPGSGDRSLGRHDG